MDKSKVIVLGKKLELNVLERLMLLNLLPKEASFTSLKLIRLVREDLSFDEAENKALQFRTEASLEGNQMMVWNNIKLTNKETDELVRAPSQVLQQMANTDPDKFEVAPACPDKEFDFGEVVYRIMKDALVALDKAGKVTEDHYSLYEKVMEDNQDETVH